MYVGKHASQWHCLNWALTRPSQKAADNNSTSRVNASTVCKCVHTGTSYDSSVVLLFALLLPLLKWINRMQFFHHNSSLPIILRAVSLFLSRPWQSRQIAVCAWRASINQEMCQQSSKLTWLPKVGLNAIPSYIKVWENMSFNNRAARGNARPWKSISFSFNKRCHFSAGLQRFQSSFVLVDRNMNPIEEVYNRQPFS